MSQSCKWTPVTMKAFYRSALCRFGEAAIVRAAMIGLIKSMSPPIPQMQMQIKFCHYLWCRLACSNGLTMSHYAMRILWDVMNGSLHEVVGADAEKLWVCSTSTQRLTYHSVHRTSIRPISCWSSNGLQGTLQGAHNIVLPGCESNSRRVSSTIIKLGRNFWLVKCVIN